MKLNSSCYNLDMKKTVAVFISMLLTFAPISVQAISESKKDIIFYEEDSNDIEDKIDTIEKIEEEDEDPLPFFIALHKS